MKQLSVFCLRKQFILKKLKLKKMQIFLWTVFSKVLMLCSKIIDVFQFFKTGCCHTFKKKGRKKLKENYRSVSILPTLSKILDRITFAQKSTFFDNFFSKYQCGFRKGYRTQHCNSKMLEKWKKICRQTKGLWCFINRPLKDIWLSRPWISHSQIECLQL